MFKTADTDSDPVNVSGVRLLEHTMFHELRTFSGCYYLFHKWPEAECLFAFPKMTLSPITCEQRCLDSLLQMEHVRDWGLGLLDPAQMYRYCLLTAHIAASMGGGWWGGERGAGHRRRRLKFHCKQKPDPETWIGSFHSCPNTRSVSAEILSTRSHRSRESCWCAQSSHELWGSF